MRLRHGDKLCVELDTPLPRKRPACTTTGVCTVCARSTPICFQATRSMESDNIARTRGHSLHDEHPRVKTVQAKLSRHGKDTLNTRCDQMRSCNGFTCVHSTVCAPRFQFSSVVDPLGNAQVQGEHLENSTKHTRSILHNTRTKHPQVECSRHPKVVIFGAVQEPT